MNWRLLRYDEEHEKTPGSDVSDWWRLENNLLIDIDNLEYGSDVKSYDYWEEFFV